MRPRSQVTPPSVAARTLVYDSPVSSVGDRRLHRFIRGELDDAEVAALEAELDLRPSLREELAALARDPTASMGAAERSGRASPSAVPTSLVVDGPERLAVGSTLGEGGMATVRRGVQTNLGRAVAIKTLRDETPSGTHRLLQEARLTARLQHPNIVPVHEIVQGHGGELQVVLKEVKGELWASLMHQPAILRSRFGAEDALDWNLGVLSAICNALAFAHEQCVLHRDVKPTNVMVGRFGEIYLLDWGIAAVWGERTDPALAHVEDAPIAGTLAYMAPEQLEGDPDVLGPWTDTYLLGATLYELLGGRPPHAGADPRESRARPRERVVPPLRPDLPRELVAIVEQAMSPDPADRIITPQAFRGLIESFRGHRASLDLVERAVRCLRAASSAGSTAERSEIERHLGEAEFGFRAALEAWPDNARARDGLRDVAIRRIEAAFAEGQLQTARRLLDTLPDPPPALVTQVEAALEAEQADRAKAARAEWNQNRAVGVAARGALVMILGPLWVAGWFGYAAWPVESATPLLVFLLVYLALGTIAVLLRARDVLEHRLTRGMVLAAGAANLAAVAWIVSASRGGLDLAAINAGVLLLFALTHTVVAVTSDARALPFASVDVAGFVIASVAPVHARQALAVSALVLTAGVALNSWTEWRRTRTAP